MMQPLISILIPVFNGSVDLPKCLDSIVLQEYMPFEVVIINDGSTDATAEICKTFAARDTRIRYFEQPNQGLAATRNRCVHEALGTLVSFVDADDDVETTYLSYLWSLMQTSSCKVSACNHWVCRGEQKRPRFSVSDCQTILTPQEAFSNILYDRYPDVSAWGKLYQKAVLERMQYPNGCLFEDTYRIAEILLASGNLVYGGMPHYHYRIHTDSLSRGCFSQSKLDFISAVDHMTEVMAVHCTGMEKGIIRRKMHALLSTRRYLVGCGEAEMRIRDDLERRIRAGAAQVLRDAQVPIRDKLGILSVRMRMGVYDALWTAYEGIRRK